MPILALANRKGGVAKTTSTVNIAAELTAAGYRVLCCDLDPQASLTLIAGLVPDRLPDEQTALAALLPELVEPDPDRLCAPAPWGGELMPANQHLANAEVALTAGSAAGPHQRLAIALEELAGRYDFVLVDSPPSMGKLVLNAICACDHLLVPVAADYVSVGGLDRLLEVVEQVRRFERKELSILGVFATQARRTLHSRETLELLGDLSVAV
jgi:chromosome partitioning protein